MREVLFRGKTTTTGDWITGYLVHTFGVYGIFPVEEPVGDLLFTPVVPETIGQYTGLQDCNGVKIFEGDVLTMDEEGAGYGWDAVVTFGNPNATYNWGWQLVPFDNNDDVNPDILLWIEMEEGGVYCFVTGNIHDNTQRVKG